MPTQEVNPMETIRLAVRALVEFTLHGEDILRLGGKAQDMQDGTLGHKARQALLGEAWASEVPVELHLPVEEEERIANPSFCKRAFRTSLRLLWLSHSSAPLLSKSTLPEGSMIVTRRSFCGMSCMNAFTAKAMSSLL